MVGWLEREREMSCVVTWVQWGFVGAGTGEIVCRGDEVYDGEISAG